MSMRGAHALALCAAMLSVGVAKGVLAQEADAGAPAASTSGAGIGEVIGVSIPVSELAPAVAFYTGTLDFTIESVREERGASAESATGVFGVLRRVATLRLGEERIELVDYLAPEGRSVPEDSGSMDRWFQHIAIVVSDMGAGYARLRERGVRHVSPGPQVLPAWNPNAGGISAFYFNDPDRHVLEIIHFPAGKGDARWQERSALFLGIDHTAIVVEDTERALTFYRDGLGMVVVGESENYGIEQERLNQVFGARLRITTLRARSGPGVELLEYVAPGGGRGMPGDARLNDLIGWATLLRAEDAGAAERSIRERDVRWISPGVVVEAGATPTRSAMSVRDPDGHAVVIRVEARRDSERAGE